MEPPNNTSSPTNSKKQSSCRHVIGNAGTSFCNDYLDFFLSFFYWKGTYIILVKSTNIAFDEFCDKFIISGFMQKNVSRCCARRLTRDTFIINRKDSGPLRLYKVFLSDCPVGYYGYNCYKCSDSCQTCDSTIGKCLSCVDPSKCGNYCNKPCQSKSSNTEFDVTAGSCSSCVPESILNR